MVFAVSLTLSVCVNQSVIDSVSMR